MEDEDVTSLPPSLLQAIDRAFDHACRKHSQDVAERPAKRPRFDSVVPAGGFIIDGESELAAGGFPLDEDARFKTDGPTHISLSLIPTALQLLDLPPADDEIMSVFRNAASGWRGAPTGHEEGVSRKDWRAVCAALLDGAAFEDEEGERVQGDSATVLTSESRKLRSRKPARSYAEDHGDYHSEDDEEEDAYEDETELDSGHSDNGEYGTQTKPLLTRSRGQRGRDLPGLAIITPRQKTACRAAFALFFPGVADAQLDAQRIMIRDISRIAKLFKERWSAEEIVEMLHAFSSSPNKSMNLSDFERMMIAAKLA